jgi:acyl-coenzyme A synthetase/AMP-(fatty) acid ligase
MTLTVSLFDRGPPPPCPPRFNLARHALFASQPEDKVALTVLGAGGVPHDRWSYGQLREAVIRTAGALRAAGLRPGERVMLRMGNSADFPIVFLGAVAAGGVATPTSAQLTPAEAAFIAADVAARFVCLGEGFEIDAPEATLLRAGDLRAGPMVELSDTGADDPAFIVYTSGSSGRPKGVIHAQRSAWARRMMWRGWYGLGPDDLMLHAGAFNWTYTLGAGLLDPWAAGAATLVYDGPRDPGVWSAIAAAHHPTLFAATPGVYRQLLKYGRGVRDAFTALRHGLTAGEKLPAAVAEAWAAETGRPLYEALGMSEVSTYASAGPEAPPRPGRVGPPQPGRRVAVLRRGEELPAQVGEIGELAVSRSDPGLMLGYWRESLPLRGEWFVTGDLAEMDADGYLAYRGRADDLMNAGGYRVAPQEVEDALLAHPGVAEAAVVERSVREGVSIIEANVVAPGLTVETLERWCADRLAAYKRPRSWVFADALPRTATGKVIRRALARR